MVTATFLVTTLALSLAIVHLLTANKLTDSVALLTAEVSRLKQEQAMPVLVLGRHRDSICYIHAVYSLTLPGQEANQAYRSRLSATGFLVAPGMVATNRHVVEPWWDDEHDEQLIRRGAKAKLEKLEAFFPGAPSAIPLADPRVSRTTDVAVVRFATPADMNLRPLPLATSPGVPGDPVVVVGYPMGVTAMLAKSPGKVYKRLAFSQDTMAIARDLASQSLIRPSATYGHLGDVVEEKLIYDAPTAQGGSGGPVFNSHGEVIGVNAAYLDGFAGGTIGISIEELKPLMEHTMIAE
ncbi:MAG: serine protease [Candidatus Korobacteraceae bacterium]